MKMHDLCYRHYSARHVCSSCRRHQMHRDVVSLVSTMAWDLEFVVPQSPEQHDAISDDEDEAVENDEYPTVVVCSGE